MMEAFSRTSWCKQIEQAWAKRSIVWLTGVRRVGKTALCHMLPNTEVFDCELPSVRKRLEDVEWFWRDLDGKRVALDEIHRLPNPSEVLKIAADHFPKTRVIATGSSTLGASSKFSDTLAGRKTDIWLTPMTSEDVAASGGDLSQRLLHGGLPPFFLASEPVERDYQEWMDAYWARDIQELFRLERWPVMRHFMELLFTQSGGMFEATRFARECGVARNTIQNYLALLSATHVAHVLRPFTARKANEIVAAPKVYAFDTGFVSMWRGWRDLRTEDAGQLWEHYVLNELQGRLQRRDIHYWRNKQGHEVDFILPRRGKPPIAIECKWRSHRASAEAGSGSFTRGLVAFRKHYPDAQCLVIASDADTPQSMRLGEGAFQLMGLEAAISFLQKQR